MRYMEILYLIWESYLGEPVKRLGNRPTPGHTNVHSAPKIHFLFLSLLPEGEIRAVPTSGMAKAWPDHPRPTADDPGLEPPPTATTAVQPCSRSAWGWHGRFSPARPDAYPARPRLFLAIRNVAHRKLRVKTIFLIHVTGLGGSE